MARSRGTTLWRTQNFLRDPKLVDRLVRMADVGPKDVVYDLGAGTGVITDTLARRGARVIAIERDRHLYSRLQQRFAERTNVDVRHAVLGEQAFLFGDRKWRGVGQRDVAEDRLGHLGPCALRERAERKLALHRAEQRRRSGARLQETAAADGTP